MSSTKIASGIDGGYWISELMPEPHRTAGYSIINIETGGRLNFRRVSQILKSETQLAELAGRDPFFVASNNLDIHHFWKNEKSLLVTNPRALWDLYANASFVITSRAHTLIACITSGTPVNYIGNFDQRVVGLIGGVGLRPQTEKSFFATKNEFKSKIIQAKQQKSEEFKAFVSEVLG